MAFLKPEDIVKQLPLEDGLIVADLGAGVGAFTIPIAKRIGKGQVYAIDIIQDLLGSVKSSAKENGVSNVEIIWGDIEATGGTKLADRSVGLVVLANVLFQAENKEGVVAEAVRILRPKGYVFVVDWTGSFGGLGPKEKDVVTEEDVKKMFLNSGFALYNKIDAGEYHFGLLFKKL